MIPVPFRLFVIECKTAAELCIDTDKLKAIFTLH